MGWEYMCRWVSVETAPKKLKMCQPMTEFGKSVKVRDLFFVCRDVCKEHCNLGKPCNQLMSQVVFDSRRAAQKLH